MDVLDLIVLGGGPAGYLAAERAARGGMKVALYEKNALGGVCLNEGCIPSKTLLNSAKLYEHALAADAYGVSCGDVHIDQKKVVARRGKVVRQLVAGVRAQMKAAGVNVIMEEAVITGRRGDDFVVSSKSGEQSAKRLLIATGASAIIPDIPGVRENLGSFCITNREALTLPEIPEKFAVIGGGVVGLEMAAYYAAVGSKVTVIELLDHIAGSTDREIGLMLRHELEKKGISFLLGHRCLSVEPGKVWVETPSGEKLAVEADKALISIGRSPNVAGIGLESLGVKAERGILTDATGLTNVPNVYAVGDVNGHHMLAHTAYREAEVAVNSMLGKPDSMRYYANPSVIYTMPELALVGRTEDECREKGIDYEVKKLSMRYSGRFIAENERADGLCKILINPRKRNIIGVQLIGSYSSEIIWGAAEMIEMQLRVEDARQIIFPHPTVSEIIRETLWEFED